MFDTNSFKKSVKLWIKDNPHGTDQDLLDFCEERIPPSQYAASQWLIDQTLSWYRHVLAQRESKFQGDSDERDAA
jgi:hypothetical protein